MSQHPNPSRSTSQTSQLSMEPHLPTHIAALRDDVEKLRHLIEEEGAPLLDEESLETPLHVAARCGSNAVIKYLLEGSDTSAVLAKAVNGSTPAHYAAISGQLASLKLLLECGGELRNDVAVEKDSQGLTILHLASLKGDERIVEYLLKQFRELEDIPNEAEDYPIHFASASGYLKVVKTFVKLCGKEVISREDVNGTLPVYFAAQEGKLEVLRYLIVEAGADPVARDNDGLTTLHAATQGGHLNVVRWLVSELGEEFITDETQDGATPIHIAAAMGCPDILEWFFKHKEGKSYVNLLDRNKRTPCHDAAEYGNMEALLVLLKYGADMNKKDSDGKTPLMLAKQQHREIADFIMEYNKEGAKILSRYEHTGHIVEEGPNVDIDKVVERRTRAESSSSVRTARTEHVELVTALSELNEFQESRLQRQESLQAIENELRVTENSEERPPRKKSKKSSSKSPDKSFKTNDGMTDADHYTADNGDIYARSRKQTRAAEPRKAKMSPGAYGGREMERKRSPPAHWYNGVAEDGGHDNRSRSHHKRHEMEEEMSVISYMSAGSRPHGPHSVQSSGYSGHSMASAYRHGYFMPYPGYGYGGYGYPMYPGPRGYPGPRAYPPMYSPYGYPPPPPMMNGPRPPHHRGRRGDGRPPHHIAGDAPKGRKAKSKSPPSDYGIKGGQMMGYGPDISDGKAHMSHQDEEPDFHPLPPPITTKDGEMKEYVTTEDQNFIMVKRTNQSQAATVHPSGLQLNPAKHPFVYDGRYDKYIEPDDDWQDADISYGVPVLAACAAILGIGVITGLRGVTRSMNIAAMTTPAHATKDRAYDSSAWDSTVVASSQHKTQKKTTSASALRGNLLYDAVDDMNSEELDPIEYSLREESGVTHTKADHSMTEKGSKFEYRSATLPSKRKGIMQMDFSDDQFAKMMPQYGESTDDSHMDQLGRGIGESLQSRNTSMLDLAPSSFRDGQEAYDSEELEGVENIVHRDVKNTQRSKESHSNREVTVTKEVSSKKTTETNRGHKGKKKKERMKGRNEKKAIATLQQSTATTTSGVTQSERVVTHHTVVDVHHSSTDGDHASSTSVTSSQDTSQLLDDIETSQSQIELLNKQKSYQQSTLEATTSQVSSSSGSHRETQQAAEKNFWHVTVESSSSSQAPTASSSNEVTMEVAAPKEDMADNKELTSNEVAVEGTVKEEVAFKEEVALKEEALHNEVTMEEAIAQLTLSSSQQTEQASSSQDVTQPTSVMVELTSVQQLQQPTVVSVDVQPVTIQASTMVQHSKDHVTSRDHMTNSDHMTTSLTQQESLNDEMTSHQVTMEKAITQVTSQHTSTVAKGSEAANQISATVDTTPPTVDEGDGTIEAVSSELDFDFSDILSGLRELSGEDEFTLQTTVQEKAAKKTSSVNQSPKKATEYHTMSLFSDVPITLPASKVEQPVSKGRSTSFQRTVPVKKEDDQYKSLNATHNIESTVVSRTSNVARQQSPASLAATVPATKESMKSATMTTNKPVDIFVTKKPMATMTNTKQSVTMTTSKPAGDEGRQQKVPLAVSHKKEMQQQKDGTDIEWDVDMGDIDIDLASQLEELNSIIGQLGVDEQQETMSSNEKRHHQVKPLQPEVTAATATIDNNLIVTLGHVSSKVASNVQLTKEETILLYETRKKVVMNIVEYCQTICKGDKSAALNLALTLSTTYNLDAGTISEISTFINTGVYTEMGVMPSTMSRLMVDNSNSGKSGSAVSLLSAEAEQALLKQQEQHMKTTERHFQEQALVQSDLKKQLLQQSKLQQEAQRQSMSFAEAQSRQSRLLEEAQKQVQEQADKLREAELKLKEAEFMSKEKAMVSDRERILREAQEQQRRAQMEYEEKNKVIETMQHQLKEMQEFQQKLMLRFEEQDQAHMKKIEEYQQKLAKAEAASGKKKVRIQESDSEDEPMMTAVGPSLQREIMAHAEKRTMEAQIQTREPLSYRLMSDDSIPGAPPVPSVDSLMSNKTRLKNRTSTIKAAERSASVFDKFEKGDLDDDDDNDDDDDDDDEFQFAQPRMISQGGREAKTALIKQKSSTTSSVSSASHSVDIPDHGYYRSTYSIPRTAKPANVKTYDKMPGEFQMRHFKVPQ